MAVREAKIVNEDELTEIISEIYRKVAQTFIMRLRSEIGPSHDLTIIT